jgi:hypothetical protein
VVSDCADVPGRGIAERDIFFNLQQAVGLDQELWAQ